jgi:hypothetical protein
MTSQYPLIDPITGLSNVDPITGCNYMERKPAYTSSITTQEYLTLMKSARQVQWSAKVSLTMFMWSQDHPILRLPLLWLHRLLLSYARWHYCRANRIYAKVTAHE